MYPYDWDYSRLKFSVKNKFSQEELNWDLGLGLGLDNNLSYDLRNTHQKTVDLKDLPQLDLVNPQAHFPDNTPTAPEQVLQPSKQRSSSKLKPPDKTACVICDFKANKRNPSQNLTDHYGKLFLTCFSSTLETLIFISLSKYLYLKVFKMCLTNIMAD